MPRHTEPSANNALGSLLQTMLGKATVRSENTQIIEGHPGLRPDILITAAGRSPVVVESEYFPAATVEEEARSRLGLNVSGGGVIAYKQTEPASAGAFDLASRCKVPSPGATDGVRIWPNVLRGPPRHRSPQRVTLTSLGAGTRIKIGGRAAP